jgi:hypothetical protein
MIASLKRMAPLAMGLLALAGSASTAKAQGNTFNPYGNSGYADYREFSYPMYSNNPALPGQAILNGKPLITRPQANTFQQFTESLESGGSTSPPPRGTASNIPYTESFRQYDKEYDRIYRPNAKADEGFDARLKKRDQAYAKAMTEKDPVKRARMLRLLEMDSLDRRPSAARTTTGTGAARTKGAATTLAPLTRAPNPFTPAPGSRSSTSAPSPYPARRSGSTGSDAAGRTPPAPRVAPSTGRSTVPAPRRESDIGLPPDPSTIAIPPPR